MLPLSAQVPASIVLLAGGAMACFAGYRLFRLVLGVYGFILGALVASHAAGASGTWTVVAAAIGGGALGALVLFAGYFVGVALVGAGFGALAVNVAWKPFGGEPHWAVVLGVAAVCAIVAMQFQRYVIILATAFGGSWTMLIGAAALMAGPGARAASAGFGRLRRLSDLHRAERDVGVRGVGGHRPDRDLRPVAHGRRREGEDQSQGAEAITPGLKTRGSMRLHFLT